MDAHATAPNRYLEANGIRYAYRRFGSDKGVPLLFLQHFRGGMDHWDPLVTDGLAERRSVILVDGAGVGGSSGATPDTIEAMAEDLRHFLTALDVKSLDVLGFSIGGTIAQSLVLQYPELALSDIDLVHGIISINKARVSGVDRDKTKTSEDRRVQLCPRALSVLRRHLRLRASLKAAGKIDHDHVFFLETGALFRSLHHPQVRWRKTLQSLKVRYRRPYTARQNSVSWNLMVGKNALWVAKQHSHSIATMLRAYAAWAEGTAEVDIGAIKRSMNVSEAPPVINLAVDLSVAEALQARRASTIRPTALRRHALTDCSTMEI
ncbi:MAG: alpha/beta hydrolase fold family protein [Gammaproteobacteria bacterium]|nr:alpha/beta hydrolase fold family protein [Gammaproteobacteria bacterium]